MVESGCLLPQAIDAIPQAPHPAPQIVDELVPPYPPVITLYRQGPADASNDPPCHCDLQLDVGAVREDDPTVSLEARWFVDYDAAVPSTQQIWVQQPLPGSFDTDTTERSITAYQFDATAHNIVTSGTHVVEVVIGETAGFDDSSTTTPHRAMLPGFEPAVFRFTVQVNVSQDPNQPLCPGQLPSVRLPSACQ
jgi:hypothetical protein